jgi:signal transduction histidine kinase
VVRGYLDILSQPNVSEDVRLSAEKALKQSIRMQKIIDDLLQLAEIRGSEARLDTQIDLAGLVKEALEDLANLDSGHVLEIEIPESVLIQGNPEQIERLISNLIGNIQAHVPTGSKVSVGVGLAEGDGVSLGVATLLADSPALAQPVNKIEPTITRGTQVRFILLKVSDFQEICRLYLNPATNSGCIQNCGVNSSARDGITDSEQLKLSCRIPN